MDALDLLQNLQTLNIPAIAADTVRGREQEIADLNAGQLAQGIRSTGTPIKPAYHPFTIEMKKGKPGLAGVTDRVTLYNTGAHYRDLYAQVQGEEIEFGSRNWKEEKLEKKYGKTIYGLTEDSTEELTEGYLRGDFIEAVEKITGL